MSLAVTTGPDGQATITYLAGGDQLVAGASRPRQLAPRVYSCSRIHVATTRRDHHHPSQADAATGRSRPEPLGATGRGPSGRDLVEGRDLLACESRRFPGWPTANGGRRLVPDTGEPAGWFVLSGGDPRLGLRADPVQVGHDRRAAPLLLPLLQRPLRTIHGRVADRQGRPLPSVEVFQSGDGPERRRRRPMAMAGSRWGAFARGQFFSSRGARVFATSAG